MSYKVSLIGCGKMNSAIAKGLHAKRADYKFTTFNRSPGKAKDLAALDLSIKLKIGQGGKSFGSVGSRDVEALLADKGIDISRKQIQLLEPIKSAGTFPIPVKLHSDVVAEIQLVVEADNVTEKKAEKQAATKEEASEVDEEALLEDELAAAEADSDDDTEGDTSEDE